MAEPLRLGVVGVSNVPACGVHDHALLQAQALGERDVSCTVHWLQCADASVSGGRAELRAWLRALPAELRADELDAVLLHYSVFRFSYRGLPVFVPGLVAALDRTGLPLVSILHEFVFPWRRGGPRGTAWAVAQRALLVALVRASSAVAVTMSWRAEWLASRVWLPARPIAVAPVFSNLPPSRPGLGASISASSSQVDDDASRDGEAATLPVVGLFGYAYEPHILALVTGAMRLLERAGAGARLLLIGAPGRDSPAGSEWLAAARTAGLAHTPEFSGILSRQALADLLASCDVLLSAEPSGPTSRKTTLAASLASGRPLVALHGRRTWEELVSAQAALVAAPDAHALADALASVLADRDAGRRLGERGQAFAARTMTPERNAAVIAGLLGELLSDRS